MQKSWILFVLLGIMGSNAQVINIPDPNFKAVLLAASTNNAIAAIGDILPDNSTTLVNVKIDTNNNGEIEVNEVQDITYLNFIGTNVNDITGIENFINLKYLLCWQNYISSMDSVSSLTHLERIICSNNQISTLDLNNLTSLKILNCSNNQINTLDFSNNPLIEMVYYGNNQLTSLDFSHNPLFNELGCKNNPNLTDINIKNGVAQQFPPNTIYNECWTGCPSLSRICADSFELSALQTYLSDCGIATAGITFTTSCALNTPDLTGTVDEIKLYPNPNLGLFTVSFASPIDFGTVEVYSMVGQRLAEVSVHNADQVTIQLPHLAAGCYLVKVSSNGQTVQKRMIIE